MICLPIPSRESGLDLNVERQTFGLLRFHAKDRHTPGQARVLAADDVCALSTCRRCVAARQGGHKVQDFS
jgi:hypothetical protein